MLVRVLIIAAVVVLLLLVLRLARKAGPSRNDLRKVLAAVGPARCLAALALLDTLSRETDQAMMLKAWDVIELPLLQALPDCPPSAKPALMNALDALAKASTNRELAKRVMTLRNGLMA